MPETPLEQAERLLEKVKEWIDDPNDQDYCWVVGELYEALEKACARERAEIEYRNKAIGSRSGVDRNGS